MPLRKQGWVKVNAIWKSKSCDVSLSNGGENAFLIDNVSQQSNENTWNTIRNFVAITSTTDT